MNDGLNARIYNNLLLKDTEELLDIWQNGNEDEWMRQLSKPSTGS